MKKILIFISLIFITSNLLAQKDFDYTFFTSHEDNPMLKHKMQSGDTTWLAIFTYKRIKKEDGILTISNLINTADSERYEIEYLGYSMDADEFIYKVKESETFFYTRPQMSIIHKMVDGISTVYY